MSEGIKLPPETTGQRYSEREQAFKNCTFFTLRKVATEGLKIDTGQTIYVNADGKPFCDYNDTIRDRNLVRQRILDYELAQGWIVDDRGAQQAVAQIVQPVPQPAVPVQETMSTVPTVPIAAAMMTINSTPAPTPQPQPQPPPASDAGAPTGKKRPGPRLPSAVAPPTTAVAQPQPPPGAMTVHAPVVTPAPVQATATMTPTLIVPEQTQVQPFTPPTAMPAPVSVRPFTVPAAPVAQAPVAAPAAPAGSDKKLDAIGSGLEIISRDVESHRKDFSQFVSNMSEQVNTNNKSIKAHDEALKEIQRSLDIVLTAIHHIYLTIPGLQAGAVEAKANIGTAPEFREYIAKFTVPRP